jgi:hypothetical protein
VGTDTAINIVVRDTIDANLDLSTLRLGAASHAYVFAQVGRELSWTFNDIYLPDSNVSEPESHGFLTYELRPPGGLTSGTVISNEAAIYFDFNPPVITNTVATVIFAGECPITLDGDVNNNGSVTSSDVIVLVNYVFKGGDEPEPCTANGDVNCNGAVTSADIIYLVNYVFKGGDPPCDICNEPDAMECVVP